MEYRQAVANAIEMLNMYPERMELFLAQPNDPLEVCLREIESCDLFVGLYARRYGSIPHGQSKSMTELEFDHAHDLGLPIFAFFLDSNHPWTDEFNDEGDLGQALENLKARIDELLTRTTFTTPDDLSTKVIASLANHQRNLGNTLREENTEEVAEVVDDTSEGPLPNQQRIHVQRVFDRISNTYGTAKLRRTLFDRNKEEKIFALKDYFNRTAKAVFSACDFSLDSGTLSLSTTRLNIIAIRLFGLLVSSAIGRFGQDEGQVSISMTLDLERYKAELNSEENRWVTFKEYARKFQDEFITDDDIEAYNASSEMSFDDFNEWWITNRNTPSIIGWRRVANIANLELAMWRRLNIVKPEMTDLLSNIFFLLHGLTSEAITNLKE